MPLITANSVNNGIAENLDYKVFRNEKKLFEKKITVDRFFNTFFHTYKYFSDDNVQSLKVHATFEKAVEILSGKA